jgi:hypothetical protein
MAEQADEMTQEGECNTLGIHYHLKIQEYTKTAIEG